MPIFKRPPSVSTLHWVSGSRVFTAANVGSNYALLSQSFITFRLHSSSKLWLLGLVQDSNKIDFNTSDSYLCNILSLVMSWSCTLRAPNSEPWMNLWICGLWVQSPKAPPIAHRRRSIQISPQMAIILNANFQEKIRACPFSVFSI